MLALYFSSVDLVSRVQLLPFVGQSVCEQSVDADRARRGRVELPLLDSGANTRKPERTVLNINYVLCYCEYPDSVYTSGFPHNGTYILAPSSGVTNGGATPRGLYNRG